MTRDRPAVPVWRPWRENVKYSVGSFQNPPRPRSVVCPDRGRTGRGGLGLGSMRGAGSRCTRRQACRRGGEWGRGSGGSWATAPGGRGRQRRGVRKPGPGARGARSCRRGCGLARLRHAIHLAQLERLLLPLHCVPEHLVPLGVKVCLGKRPLLRVVGPSQGGCGRRVGNVRGAPGLGTLPPGLRPSRPSLPPACNCHEVPSPPVPDPAPITLCPTSQPLIMRWCISLQVNSRWCCMYHR